MTDWIPRVTVATVIARKDRYLLVEERDKHSGELVFNQPARHLERGETLAAAALRVALYTAPPNGVTYYRTTFLAEPVAPVAGALLDADIHAVQWLDYGWICAHAGRMRSALVIADIDRHRSGVVYPLDIIVHL